MNNGVKIGLAALAVLLGAMWLSPPRQAQTVQGPDTKFVPGQCARAHDGYVWKIQRIEGDRYVLAGWQGNGWGNDTKLAFRTISDHVATECPSYR